jgi:hypothetical protein
MNVAGVRFGRLLAGAILSIVATSASADRGPASRSIAQERAALECLPGPAHGLAALARDSVRADLAAYFGEGRESSAADEERARRALRSVGREEVLVQSVGNRRNVVLRLLPQDHEDVSVNAISASVGEALRKVYPDIYLQRVEVIRPQLTPYPACQADLEILFTFVSGGANGGRR